MWNREDTILVTNNDFVYNKYKGICQVVLADSYEDVLIRVRDLVYDRHILLTHPQASSLKPNQTLYRSIAVYPKGKEDNTKDILLIEKCLEVYYQWQQIAPSPKSYAPNVDKDFKTIDLSVVDEFMPRIGEYTTEK